MTSPAYNKKSPTIKRILREAAELASSPSPDFHAAPLESNLFEWHFTLAGPPSTPYEHGIYHGRITLPSSYPLRPPSFRFLTPSGRFEVNAEICLSISEHHEEHWQPAWGVRTAVVALRGFMESDAGGQVGGMQCSDEARRKIAGESRAWRCGECGRSNEEVLREMAELCEGREKEVESVPEGLRVYEKEKKEAPMPAGQSVEREVREQRDSPAVRQVDPGVPEGVLLQGQQQPQAQPQQRHGDTPWLDRVIVALLAILIALVLRRYA